MTANLDQANAAVTVVRVLQGLHRVDGRPYTPDDVVAACEHLGAMATKRLLVGIPVSRSAIVQTLDHLSELDDDETPADDVEVVYVAPVGSTTRVEVAS